MIRLYLFAAVCGVSVQLAFSMLGFPLDAYLETATGLHTDQIDRTLHPIMWLMSMPEFWIGVIAVVPPSLLILASRIVRRQPAETAQRLQTVEPATSSQNAEPAPETLLPDHSKLAVALLAAPKAVQPKRIEAASRVPVPARRDAASSGPEAPAGDNAVDVDLLYRAALYAAQAAGGITGAELLAEFEDLTGLAAPAWARELEDLRMVPRTKDGLRIFDELTSVLDRRIVMALVLKIGSKNGRLPLRTKALVERLASCLDLTRGDVEELFAAVHAPDEAATAA